jgi:hypothetical protein
LGWIDADPAIDARGEFGWRGNCELDVADDEYGLLGHLDGLTRPLVRREVAPGVSFLQPTVEEDPEGVRYVVDIKSISTRPYIFYQESGELEKIVPSAFEKLERAKIEHIQQISTYAWMTTRPGFKADRIAAPLSKIPEIMVVYVGKDLDPRFYEKYPKTYPLGSILNLPLKVFTFSVDPECVAVYLTKTNKIWDYHRRGELPPRDYHYTPTHPQSACEYCGYAPVCYRKEGWFQDAALESDLLLIDHALASPRQTS